MFGREDPAGPVLDSLAASCQCLFLRAFDIHFDKVDAGNILVFQHLIDRDQARPGRPAGNSLRWP